MSKKIISPTKNEVKNSTEFLGNIRLQKIFLFCLFIILNIGSVLAENKSIFPKINDEQAHYLVLHETPEDVKKLIQSGYDVNKVYLCNTLLNTAVQSAAKGSQMSRHPSYALEKIKILVDAGADVDAVPCFQKTMPALSWAISLPTQVEYTVQIVNKVIDERIKNGTGECDIPTVVSKSCKDVTPAEREKIREALHSSFMIMNKSWVPYFMDIIEYLVSKGADVNGNKESDKKISPIHLAVMNPEEITLKPLEYLIEKGVNVNVQDWDGNTPLFWAFGSGNRKAIILLINAGADVNVKNKDGLLFNEVTSETMHTILDENGKIILKKL